MTKMLYYFLLTPVDLSHKLHTSQITTGPIIEHSSVGCRVCREEYVYKLHNAVVTTRFVWNVIKVKLNMFFRFICCYLNKNNYVFHHTQLLLPLLELLRSITTLKINFYITLWVSFGFFFSLYFYLHAKYYSVSNPSWNFIGRDETKWH